VSPKGPIVCRVGRKIPTKCNPLFYSIRPMFEAPPIDRCTGSVAD